jgi:Transposase DDE domain group 1
VTWSVGRFEATQKGFDARYVVTNFAHCGSQSLYDTLYCARGQAENLIKRRKSQLASDCASCRSPLANSQRRIDVAEMRLILHTAAYWLTLDVRGAISRPQPLASGEFSTIRPRLLKIAVLFKETASRVRLAFASNCPDAALFRGLDGTLILRPT